MNGASAQRAAARFGTFGGVFTPCTLTILGVIMFLRLGYVVGQAGMLAALAIVLISKAITVLTSLSLSAIATNTRVQGGGAYYLISRSLGVEFGGAIGVVFFLAQAISVAMYVIGFSEAFVGTFSGLGWTVRDVATVVNVLVFCSVYVGAGWAIKIQYVILAMLVASLLSFFGGAAGAVQLATMRENLWPQFTEGEDFFTAFALFFPAVTGIMAGANMSGDLKEPGRAIPTGTLAAVLVTAIVYLAEVVLLAATCSRTQLLNDTLVMYRIALVPWLITVGVFAATLSSALGSMMGAPRILQAFARDDVVSWLKFFARGSGRTGEPRRATVLCFLISQTCILLGDLNAIAPVITMAFMITYGMLNLATFYEAITRNPSYRPRFRYCHWSTSLAGAVGCLAVMFLLDWMWASLSIGMMGLIYWAISRQELEARWGDVRSGLRFERARRNLLRLEQSLTHPKNWRPIILALIGAAPERSHLAIYGHWFTAGHGILSLGQVITGEIETRLERRRSQEQVLRAFIERHELEAFPAVVVAPYVSDGIEYLVQCHGLGALRPNTVLVGWPSDRSRVESFGATLRTLAELGKNIIAVRMTEDPADAWHAPPGSIDVWWRGEKNGALMLLLAYLLRRNDPWRDHTIRLLRIVSSPAGEAQVRQHLRQLTIDSRIPAQVQVIVGEDVSAAIQQHSRDAAVVFLGFDAPAEGDEAAFFDRVESLAGPLPRVVLVDSVGGIELEV